MNTSKLNLTKQYKEHSAETDKIVETLKELVATNKIMHDGLGEAQTMIGERDLVVIAKDKEIEMLRNAVLMGIAPSY